MSPKIYGIVTAAKKSGLAPATIRKYCVNGMLKSSKVPSKYRPGFQYEIKEEDLLKFMGENKITPGPKESGTKIGPYRIRRVKGVLVTERVG